MQLLGRDGVLERLEVLLKGARDGHGRAVLVRGEVEIGKTSAVRAFTELHTEDALVLWGGCDDLIAARPLGPIWERREELNLDVLRAAEDLGCDLARAVHHAGVRGM